MSEKPILFSDKMVCAILDGRKTQTRRVFSERDRKRILPNHKSIDSFLNFAANRSGEEYLYELHRIASKSPYGKTGDHLWVRECWGVDAGYDDCSPLELPQWMRDFPRPSMDDVGPIHYRASHLVSGRWRPSIHMPRWASRIDLLITGIRVERLQDITEEDARAEGTSKMLWQKENGEAPESDKEAFQFLWQSINGPESWSENPRVWAISFERKEAS